MRFYPLLLVSLILTSLGSIAAAADQGCVAVFEGRSSYPTINVRMVPLRTDVEHDHSLDRRQLTRKSDGRIARQPNTVVNGLTVANLRTSIKGNFSLAEMPNGTTCVWPALVELALGYESMRVFVARDFRPNTCQHDVTMEHEHVHVDINRNVLNNHAPSIRHALKQSVRQNFPRQMRTSDQVIQQAIQVLKRDVQPSIERMVRERDAMHAELDSPESYAYWQSLCDQW